MAKIGRPKVPKAEKKGQTLTVRLTDAERKAVDAAAKREGVPVSEWGRLAIVAAASASASA